MKERPNLNELAKEIYEANKKKGFHDKEYSNEHYLMLVITELSEAVEADRKEKKADLNRLESWLKEDKEFFTEPFVWFIKDTVADELADAIIRLLDLAGLRGVHVVYEEPYSVMLSSFNLAVYMFYLSTSLNSYGELDELVSLTVGSIEALAHSLNIDIWRHVDLKLKYNATRERLHGKKY